MPKTPFNYAFLAIRVTSLTACSTLVGMTSALDTSAPGPLDGVVVADFSRVLAGPYATMMLADMGATVIKVESATGDDTRTWLPPVHEGVSTYYLSVNRNKHSIVLDLKTPEDLETANEILARADVFIENFKPGGLKKFGLDADTIATKYPHLVHASITGFGTEGGAELPGYDVLVQATSGLMSVTGNPEGEPQKAGVAIFDVVTGLHAAVGILGALHERKTSGRGQHVAVNLLSSALSGLVNQTSAYVAGGVTPTRMGNDHPSLFPYGPFQAADRAVMIACGNDTQFRRLAETIGAPQLGTDERFVSMSLRNSNRTQLRELIEAQLATSTADEWVEALRGAGIPCSLILTVSEGVEFATGLGLQPAQPTGPEAVPTVKHPVDYSRSPIRYDKAPPSVGQDEAFVRNWLAETPAPNGGPTYDAQTPNHPAAL